MSTQLSQDLQNEWNEILGFKNDESEIKHCAQMLMFSFLSETEKFQKLQGIRKNRLAEQIKTSPSYLTQLFRGTKPLNFETIAKFQKALNISFSIVARPCNAEMTIDEDFFLDWKCNMNTRNGVWLYRNYLPVKEDVYNSPLSKNIINKAIEVYDDKAIPA